jgi:hypothetical protein
MWFSDMLSVLRPSFEVVKEGRISKKIKQLYTRLYVSFYLMPVWRQNLIDFNAWGIREPVANDFFCLGVA